MRCDIRLLTAAVLLAAALSTAGAPSLKKADAAKKPDPAPLVRLDLLGVPPAEPAAPLRSIFSPGRAVAAPESVPPTEVPEATDEDKAGLETPTGTLIEQPAIDLAYIGYVRSGRKIVALVVSDGLALAVAEGQEVFPGVKVEKIGPDRIEVVGPDGKRMSVLIQGEQP
jgi:hypothetical protein